MFESEWLGQSEDDEKQADEGEADAVKDDSKPKKRRGGKRGRIVIPDAMPRKEIVHPLREEDIPEHLRGRDDLRRFRKKVVQYVEVVEVSGYVVEEYIEVLAADNADATQTEMVRATYPITAWKTHQSLEAKDPSRHDREMDDQACSPLDALGGIDAK